MIIMAIGVFIAFVQVVIVGKEGLFIALIAAAIEIYFIVCVYSLYEKFKDESPRIYNGPIQLLPQPSQTLPSPYTNQAVIYTQQPTPYDEPPPSFSQVEANNIQNIPPNPVEAAVHQPKIPLI